LRLVGIDDVETANRWLREHYIGEYNKPLAIAPEQEGSAFVPDRARDSLRYRGAPRSASQHDRLGRRRLQLPESRLRPDFVKARVRVHEYPDKTVSVTTPTARCSLPRPLRTWLDRVEGWPSIAPSALTGGRHGHP
jgi:hypothetical protein